MAQSKGSLEHSRNRIFNARIVDLNDLDKFQNEHDCHYVIASSSNCSIVMLDGTIKQLDDGSVCYIGPKFPFKLTAVGEDREGIAILCVNGFIANTITKSCTVLPFHITNRPIALEYFNILYRKIGDIDNDNEKANRTAVSYYQLLIEVVYSPPRVVESKSTILAQKIKSYIEENICTDISVSSVAKYFFLSETHVIRIFKEKYGETPKQYIIKCKVNASKLLLLDTPLQINEIAMTFHFADSYHFSHTFKRLTGSSPEKYRTLAKDAPSPTRKSKKKR